MPDSSNNITTCSPVGDVEEARLEVGEGKSKIILLLERGKIKTGSGSCLQEGVKAKCHGV